MTPTSRQQHTTLARDGLVGFALGTLCLLSVAAIVSWIWLPLRAGGVNQEHPSLDVGIGMWPWFVLVAQHEGEALCCVAPQSTTLVAGLVTVFFSGTIVICIKAYWSSLRVLHASAYIAFVLVGTLLLWASAVMVIWGPDGSWMPPERDPVPVMDMGEDEPNEPIGLNRDKGLPIPFDEGTVVDVSPKPWQTEWSPSTSWSR